MTTRTTTLAAALLVCACNLPFDPEDGGTAGGAASAGGGEGGGNGSTGGGSAATGGGTSSPGGGTSSTGGGAGGGTSQTLSAPTLTMLTPGNATVEVRWLFTSGATAYEIHYGASASALTEVRQVPTSPTRYTVSGLTNGQTYFFAVRATAQSGAVQSPLSNVLSAIPLAPALDVTGTTPDAGTTGFPRNGALQLRFSTGVQSTSVMLSLSPPVPLGWQWSTSYDRLTLTPSNGAFFAANTTYTLSLQSAQAFSGLMLRAPFTLTFTTGATPQPAQELVPAVTAVNPADGTMNVVASPSITVTFNKQMEWASVVNSLSLGPDAGLFNCAQQSNYTAFRCTTSTLARGVQYTFRVAAGARSMDDGGLTLPAPFTSTFTTLPPDLTPPTVVSFRPDGGEQGQDRREAVRITFSEPMDCASVRAAFTFVSPSRALSTFDNCSGTTPKTSFTLEPSTSFAHGDTVSWQLGTGARDVAGNALQAPLSSTFRVARVATMTLNAVGGLDGTLTDGGGIDTMAASLRVGALPGNLEQRGFVTFDFTPLPANTVNVISGTLNLTQTGTTGSPFSKFTNVGAYGLDYGATLEPSDFFIRNDTHLEVITVPFPPFFIPTEQADYTSVSATASAVPVVRSVDVTQQTMRQWDERSQRGSRMQFRLSFTGIRSADGGTNMTSSNDEVRFNTAEAGSGRPSLVVDYEYP